MNIKLCEEGRREFVQEKLFEHFHNQKHHRTHGDMIVQIIDRCDPNNQKKGEIFWIHKSLYPDGLNQKRII